MLRCKLVFGMLRNRELLALDRLVAFGRFGHNRSQLLRAIIDVGVGDDWYTDVVMHQQLSSQKTDCQMSCRIGLETYAVLAILAKRREIAMSKFVRRMILACYYCDGYQDAVREVLNG